MIILPAVGSGEQVFSGIDDNEVNFLFSDKNLNKSERKCIKTSLLRQFKIFTLKLPCSFCMMSLLLAPHCCITYCIFALSSPTKVQIGFFTFWLQSDFYFI